MGDGDRDNGWRRRRFLAGAAIAPLSTDLWLGGVGGLDNGWGVERPADTADSAAEEGYLGRYYNLSEEHADMERESEPGPSGLNKGLVKNELPLRLTEKGEEYYNRFDWYSPQYLSRVQIDDAIDFDGADYFPLRGELPGDPFHFAIHWTAEGRIEESGSYTFRVASDDDMWVFLDGNLIVDNGGLHSTTRQSQEVDVESGEHTIDVYFAERHTDESTAVMQPPDAFELLPQSTERQTVGELNTGWDDDADAKLSVPNTDPEWQFVLDGRPEGYSAPTPLSAYVVSDDDWQELPDSRWLAPGTTKAEGTLRESDIPFGYETTFRLAREAESPLLRLRAWADNRVKSIELNGEPLDFVGAGRYTGSPVGVSTADPSLFRAGDNRLRIVAEEIDQEVTGVDAVGTVRAKNPSVDLDPQEPEDEVLSAETETIDLIVLPGEERTAEFELTNTSDSDLSGVSVEVTTPANEVTIGSVDAPTSLGVDETATVTVTLDATPESVGTHELSVTTTADGFEPTSSTYTLKVQSPLRFEVTDGDAVTGKQNDVEFTVYNDGDEPLEGVSMTGGVEADVVTLDGLRNVPDALEPGASRSEPIADVTVGAAAEGEYTIVLEVETDRYGRQAFLPFTVQKTVDVGVDLPTDAAALEPGEETVTFTFRVAANDAYDVADVQIDPKFRELPGDWSAETDEPLRAAAGDLASGFDDAGGDWERSTLTWSADELNAGETRSPRVRIAVPEGIDSDRYLLETLVRAGQTGEFSGPLPTEVASVDTELNVVERFLGVFVSPPEERLVADQAFTLNVWVWFEDAPVRDPSVTVRLPTGFSARPDESTAELGSISTSGGDPVWQYDGELEPGDRLELSVRLETPSPGDINQSRYELSATAAGEVAVDPGRLPPTASGQTVSRTAAGEVLISQFEQTARRKRDLAERVDALSLSALNDAADATATLEELRNGFESDEYPVEQATDAAKRLWMGEAVSTRLLEAIGPNPEGTDYGTLFDSRDYNLARSTAGPIVLSVGGVLVEVAVIGIAAAAASSIALIGGGLATALRSARGFYDDAAKWLHRKFIGQSTSRERATEYATEVAEAQRDSEAVDEDSLIGVFSDRYDRYTSRAAENFVRSAEVSAQDFGSNADLGPGVRGDLDSLMDDVGRDAVRAGLGGDRRAGMAAGSAGISKMDTLAETASNLVDTFDGPDLNALFDAVGSIIEAINNGDLVGVIFGLLNTLKEVALSVYNALTGGLLGSLLGIEGIEKLLMVHHLTMGSIPQGQLPDWGSVSGDLL